ncbi:hypothetical protein ACFCXH_41930 [Streptomyces nojiriensis]|uniref:hypothetical protein n=1 Tax=Streptomyces nojiriensis TaxID=66374 RepID=UPI0035E19867
METVVLIALIIFMIGVAMRWIHVLNARDEARIEARRFSDPLPRPSGLPDDTGRRAHHTSADR